MIIKAIKTTTTIIIIIIMETNSANLGTAGDSWRREERYVNFTSTSCSLVNVIVASMLAAATL